MELDNNMPTRLHLRGKPGQKAVVLDFAEGSKEEDNARGAQQWAAALGFLIKSAISTS